MIANSINIIVFSLYSRWSRMALRVNMLTMPFSWCTLCLNKQFSPKYRVDHLVPAATYQMEMQME